MSRPIATVLLALMLAGGLALPAVPCFAGRWPVVTALVYAGGSLVCHQRPERSLTTCGRQWPVCGRCSGLYLGAAFGVLVALTGAGSHGGLRQWRSRVLVVAVPTLALWLGEVAGLGDPGTAWRLALAVPVGIMIALWLSAVARGDLR